MRLVLVALLISACGSDDSRHIADARGGDGSSTGCAGPAANWEADEGSGTTAADSSGHAHTLTLQGATWVAGHDTGSALHFDGASYANTPYDASFMATRALSVTLWLRPGTVGNGYQSLVVKSELAGPVQDWGVYQVGSELGALYNFPTSADLPPTTTGAGLVAGTWTFLAFVLDVDAGTTTYYKDGAIVGTTPSTEALLQNDAPITIGVDGGMPNYLTGDLDNIRVWTRALSAADLALVQADGCK